VVPAVSTFILVGEGQPAARALQYIIKQGGKVEGVFTKAPWHPLIVNVAKRWGVCVGDSLLLSPKGRRERSDAFVSSLTADWLLSVNNMVILDIQVLDRFPSRAFNLHPGLLPEYGGVHVHQWALREGATEFGACVHEMVARVDAGDIIESERFPIDPQDTGLSLFQRTMETGVGILCRVVDQIIAGTNLGRCPQDLAKRRVFRSADAQDPNIDWNWTASEVQGFVRAGNYGRFQSPTYTARLDVTDEMVIEVMGVSVGKPTTAPPGTIIEEQKSVVVACAGGTSITIDSARVEGRSVELGDWMRYFLVVGKCLRGRLPVSIGFGINIVS